MDLISKLLFSAISHFSGLADMFPLFLDYDLISMWLRLTAHQERPLSTVSFLTCDLWEQVDVDL